MFFKHTASKCNKKGAMAYMATSQSQTNNIFHQDTNQQEEHAFGRDCYLEFQFVIMLSTNSIDDRGQSNASEGCPKRICVVHVCM
jgi:hypothetical protein